MLKIMAAFCIIGGGGAAFYAASLTNGATKWHGPSWLYQHY